LLSAEKKVLVQKWLFEAVLVSPDRRRLSGVKLNLSEVNVDLSGLIA